MQFNNGHQNLKDNVASVQQAFNARNVLKDKNEGKVMSTEATQYGIFSLDDAINGQVSATLKGRTVTNLLADAVAVCEDTSRWNDVQTNITLDASNVFKGTYCIKATLHTDKTNGTAYASGIFSLINTSKYYLLSAYVKNGDLSTGISLKFDTNDTDVESSSITNSSWTRVGVVIQPSDIDAATAASITLVLNGAGNQYAYFDAIMLNEITADEYALGADALLSRFPWHLGTKSTLNGRIVSDGKNRFNKNTVTANYQVDNTDGTDTASTGENASDYIKIDSSDDCYISGCSNTSNTDGAYYDINKTYISGFTSYGALTVPSNTVYVRFTIDTDDLDTALFEHNIASTTYEPYKESILHSPLPSTMDGFKSLPNGTQDEVSDDGKVTQRVSNDTEISGTDYDSIDNTTYTNVDVIKTTTSIIDVAGTTAADGSIRLFDSSGVEMQEVAQADIDNVLSDGKFYVHTDKSIWYIKTADDYADIAAARTGLGTTTVTYQLATPLPYYLDPQYLDCYPKGTIWWESCHHGAKKPAFGTGQITVGTTDAPVDSIDSVYRVDIADNGIIEYVDVTDDCSMEADNVTMTITDYDSDKVYIYDCLIDSAYSTIPTITESHPVGLINTVGVTTHDYEAASADWTLTTSESKCTLLSVTNAGGAANIIAPDRPGTMYVVKNGSGQEITIKISGGTGITVANTKTATVMHNGTDYMRLTADV